jgi:folate-binding Fe-S cluster repair protein YgfZ
VTNDVEGLAPGEGCYAAFLTPKGKMQGDLRVLNVGPPTPELWWTPSARPFSRCSR